MVRWFALASVLSRALGAGEVGDVLHEELVRVVYQLVPQEGAMKGVLSTDAAEAPSEPPTPPVVENGCFTGFCFGDDLQEDDK